MPLGETLFLDFLKRHKLISGEQATKCLELLSSRKSLDKTAGLIEVLITNNFLKKEQIEQVLKVWVEAGGFPPLPGYELIAKLGKGAMGTVFKAQQLSMDRTVAIKVMSPHLAKDKQFVERFIREARAVAKLNHENIIKGIDVGDYFSIYYFVMEFIDGCPLSEILKKEGRIEEKKALNFMLQTARALEHANKNFLIHRDVKPENIMITKEGTAKLCDLGLAKRLIEDTSLTQSGTAVGTPNYISPEQARGEENIDIRADIYSLGATFYHLLTGDLPFPGDNAAVVMTKHITEPLIPPKKKIPQLSDQTNSIIIKCMQKHKEDRYQTPADLIKDLEKAIEGKEVPPPKVEHQYKKRPSRIIKLQKERKKSPAGIFFAIISIVIIGGIILFLAKQGKKTDETKKVDDTTKKPVITHHDIPKQPDTDIKKPAVKDEDEAKIALDTLVAFVKTFGTKPEKFKFLIEKFDVFFNEYKLSKHNSTALELFANFKKSAEEIASQHISPLITKAKELKSQDRLFEAFQSLQNISPDFDFTNVFNEAKLLSESIKKEFEERFITDKQKIEEKISKKEFDEAEKICLKIATYGNPDMKKESDLFIAKIKKLREEEFRSAIAIAEESYLKFYQQFKEFLFKRNYDRAVEFVDENLKKKVFKVLEERLKDDLNVAKLLKELEQDTYDGLDKLAESKTVIKLKTSKDYSGTIEKKIVNNETKYFLIFSQISGSTELTFLRLSEEDIVSISNFVLDQNSSRTHYKYGLLWFFIQEPKAHTIKKAKEEFLEAKSKGEQAVERYLKEIEIYEAELQAAQIDNVLEKISQDITKAKYKDAYKSLQELIEKYPGALSGSRKDEINKMLAKCKSELLIFDDSLIKKIFKGKVQMFENFKFEAFYNFSDEEQLKDWKVNEIFPQLKPVLLYNEEQQIIQLAGSISFQWKGNVINDVTVETDCIVIGERNIGITLANDKDSKNGYMYILNIQVGERLGSLFQRKNGIYKYDLNKLDFSKPLEALNSFKNLDGKDSPDIKKGEEYKLKASLKGKKVIFQVDKEKIAEAEDSTYTGPCVSLLVISREGAKFDNVKITGTLDKDWLKKQILEVYESSEENKK